MRAVAGSSGEWCACQWMSSLSLCVRGERVMASMATASRIDVLPAALGPKKSVAPLPIERSSRA